MQSGVFVLSVTLTIVLIGVISALPPFHIRKKSLGALAELYDRVEENQKRAALPPFHVRSALPPFDLRSLPQEYNGLPSDTHTPCKYFFVLYSSYALLEGGIICKFA